FEKVGTILERRRLSLLSEFSASKSAAGLFLPTQPRRHQMNRPSLKFILALLLATVPVSLVRGGIINGGFETGTFNGWSGSSASNLNLPNPPGNYLFAPVIGPGNTVTSFAQSAIVSGPGNDPFVAGLGGNVTNVFGGGFAARVNDSGSGANVNKISQSFTATD